MDTRAAIELAGGIRHLAEMLGLSTQAVYAWGPTVPKLRMYELRDMHPEWFETPKKEAA